MTNTARASMIARLELACELYNRWYTRGIPHMDGGAVAYELVSAIRSVLTLVSSQEAAAPNPQLQKLVSLWQEEVLHYELENPGPISPHVAEAYRICADELSKALTSAQTPQEAKK